MTLWNHPDVSSLPFKKVDKNSLIDAKSEGLRLFDGTRDLLKGIKENYTKRSRRLIAIRVLPSGFLDETDENQDSC